MLISFNQPTPSARVTFSLETRRELPCGCGSHRASVRGAVFACDKCGTAVDLPPSVLQTAQVISR